MRFANLFGEAFRNIRSGSSRAGVMVFVLVLVSTVLLAVDTTAIGAMQERARSIRSQAGAVRVLVAADAIEPPMCSSLERLASITHAGPIWQLDPIHRLALPRIEVPFVQISPGVARMLNFPSALSGGIYIPSSLAERWHAREGSRLDTSNGTIVIAGVYSYSEDDGRDPRLANAIVVIGESSERASECWYSVWPPSNASDQYLYGAVTTTGEGDAAPQIVPLNPTIGQRFEFAREYSTRVTALTSAAVVLLFGVLAFSGTTRRRMELAGNLHAGARRRDVVAVIVAETFLWSLGAAIATFVFTRLAARFLLRDTLAGYETSLMITVIIAAGAAIIGAAIPPMLTREDRLFTIFKSRA